MTRLQHAIGTALAVGLAGFAPGLSLADASSADLARCAAIGGATPRLACYDALAGRVAPAAPAPAAAPATPAATGGAIAPSANSAAAPAASDTQTFGLSKAQQHVVDEGPQAIEAKVTKINEDRQSHISVVLDNGQVWWLSEQDTRLKAGDPVTIKRAALGSFMLYGPSKQSYRVRRAQ